MGCESIVRTNNKILYENNGNAKAVLWFNLFFPVWRHRLKVLHSVPSSFLLMRLLHDYYFNTVVFFMDSIFVVDFRPVWREIYFIT